jgi:hypothetical protein
MGMVRRAAALLFLGCVLAFAGGLVLDWIDAAPAWFYVLGAVLTAGTLSQALGPWMSSRQSLDFDEWQTPMSVRLDRAMLHVALLRHPPDERARWEEELHAEISSMAHLDPARRRLILLALLLPNRQRTLKLVALLGALTGIGVAVALTLGVVPAVGIIGGLLTGGLIDRLWLAERLSKETKDEKRRGT